MKIHVEFNSIAEMVNFSKFAGNDLVQPPVQPKRDRNLPIGASSWEDAFKRTEANLERAYHRIREFEHFKSTNKVVASEVAKIEIKKNAIAYDKRKEEEKNHIDVLELPVRAHNCLCAESIYTIPELVTKTENDLRKIPNMGKVSIKEIKEALARNNLRLAE
jgi:DNA-directed RNA polymerase alpha subunit